MFPAASLIVSSIIPARGRHLMNPAILSSNRNLHSVCDALKITFVDNTSTFVAKSNAAPPSPDLYEDPLHPSRKGMLKLARNIKYPGAEFTMFQTDGCGPHLYPSGAIRHHSDQPAHQQQPDRSDNLTVDKRLLPLILRFSPLVDSLPPFYPYALEVLCFHLTILPWQSRTYTLTAVRNNHGPPIPLRRYHKPCASCRGSFSRSSRRKMERKKM